MALQYKKKEGKEESEQQQTQIEINKSKFGMICFASTNCLVQSEKRREQWNGRYKNIKEVIT